MKKKIYIFLFSILGALVGFLAKGLVELKAIELLLFNFEKYSFGMSFENIVILHNAFSFLALFLGALVGFFQGKYWWRILYEKKTKDRQNITY